MRAIPSLVSGQLIDDDTRDRIGSCVSNIWATLEKLSHLPFVDAEPSVEFPSRESLRRIYSRQRLIVA
jgi:hypothetical protein